MSLREDYQRRFYKVLKPLGETLQEQLQGCLAGTPRIDRVQARAKSVDRFLAKAEKQEDGKPKYAEPLHQIRDQIGARVIAFYLSDVDGISKSVERYYRPVEAKSRVPESEWKFGYFGRHYVMLMPSDLILPEWGKADVPQFFELQIKTLFQHAWSEANHDLGYKPGANPLPAGAERRLAFASAQAWGADQIFEELHRGVGGAAGGSNGSS
jgi:ppGpp synthetase/RelA/SpoT-type nucleotidyltranferase